jgi:hypothetical protein
MLYSAFHMQEGNVSWRTSAVGESRTHCPLGIRAYRSKRSHASRFDREDGSSINSSIVPYGAPLRVTSRLFSLASTELHAVFAGPESSDVVRLRLDENTRMDPFAEGITLRRR